MDSYNYKEVIDYVPRSYRTTLYRMKASWGQHSKEDESERSRPEIAIAAALTSLLL